MVLKCMCVEWRKNVSCKGDNTKTCFRDQPRRKYKMPHRWHHTPQNVGIKHSSGSSLHRFALSTNRLLQKINYCPSPRSVHLSNHEGSSSYSPRSSLRRLFDSPFCGHQRIFFWCCP